MAAETVGVDGFAGLEPPSEMPAVDLVQLAKLAFRRSPFIIILTILAGLLGLAGQSLVAPRYTSSASLLIDPGSPTAFGAKPAFADAVYVDGAKIASVASVLLSEEVLLPVVRQQRLADDPAFTTIRSGLISKMMMMAGLKQRPPPADDPISREDRALQRLANLVKVERVGLTYEITIAVTADTPEKAARLAQAVAESYLKDQVRLKTEEIELDGEWLSQRLTELRQKLIDSEAAAERIRHKYGLTETDKGPGSTISRQVITELNGQLVQAEADLAARKAEWSEVQRIIKSGGDLASLPQAAADRTIQDLEAQKVQDLRQIALLQSQTNRKFPLLQNAQRDVEIINTRIAAEVGKIAEGIRTAYETAVARRDALEHSLHQSISAADSSVTAGGRQELHQAETIVEANKELYNALLNHWRDVELQASRGRPEARILSDAQTPDRPSFPKPILFAGGGGVLGGLLGVAFVCVGPLTEKRIISTADAEKTLGLPVLGAVPRLRTRAFAGGDKRLGVLDCILRDPNSPIAESLRTLRVFLGSRPGGACRIIQFTSAIPGEGKSTVAGAFALSAAVAGVRTLLLDTDARYPSVSDMFDLEHTEGLVDVIHGATPIRTVTQPHRKLPLAIIGAGTRSLLQPDLASSLHLAKMVRELSTQFDLVILDSPPTLPVSDALAIANFADCTILVVEWRATPRMLATQAIRALRQVRAPIAGIVLNKIDPARASEYRYAYQYGYGRHAKPAPRRWRKEIRKAA